MGKVELLAPGGSYSKMMTAYQYGADAVYIGSDAGFGLRANCDNFSLEEIESAVKYANEHGKKLYVTLNIFPRDNDVERMVVQAQRLNNLGVHGIIVSDAGAFTAISEKVPDLPIHVSTQANNLNSHTCRFWKKMGATRVNLARELTFDEVKNIALNVGRDIELEVFVHGAMCMSYSGRCMLSDFMTGRSSNRGDCAQPCRWEYIQSDGTRDAIYVEENPATGGTYLFNSKDLCLLPYLPDLVKAGVHSLKIEGRMKSEFYVALVVRAYRIALDMIESGVEMTPDVINNLLAEVNMVSHRDYSTGFFIEGTKGSQIYTSSSYVRGADYVGLVSNCEAENDAFNLLLSQRSVFETGDTIEFVEPCGKITPHVVGDMFNDAGEKITRAPHAKMNVHMTLPFSVKKGSIVRKVL